MIATPGPVRAGSGHMHRTFRTLDTQATMDTPKTFQDLIAGDKPVLDEFKGMMGDQATVIKVDVDRNPAAARAYEVRGVPTLIIFKKGRPVWRRSGVLSAAQLKEAIAPHL